MGIPGATVGVMAGPARSPYRRDMKVMELKTLVTEYATPVMATIAELILNYPFWAISFFKIFSKYVSICRPMRPLWSERVVVVVTVCAFDKA